MNRKISVKIPEEIISLYDKDKHIIESVGQIGVYASSRIKRGLESGNIVGVNTDLQEVLNSYPELESFRRSDFMYEYHEYIEYALSKIMEKSDIKLDSKKDRIAMFLALGKTQETFDETKLISFESISGVAEFKCRKSCPHSFNKHNQYGKMCTVFAKIGTGEIKTDTINDINYEQFKLNKENNSSKELIK